MTREETLQGPNRDRLPYPGRESRAPGHRALCPPAAAPRGYDLLFVAATGGCTLTLVELVLGRQTATAGAYFRAIVY
eukprot:scaffold40272_cov68-Phaeocystis_antarctica.AAC.4